MSPAPPIAAALILTALLLIEKTPRKCQFGKKSAKVNHSLYSSTEQLQVALRTYIFSLVWIKQRKVYSHPPSPICPFPISPSISLPLQTLRLVSLVSLIIKTKRIAERSAIVTG
jgi:hypothetical protein